MSGIRPEGYKPEIVNYPDNVVITATYDFSEVKQRVRTITLFGAVIPGFYPYRLSTISLEEIRLDQLHPCSLYALESQIEIERQLREAFLKQGIDLLKMTLEKSLIEYNWGDQKNCIISPPLVEVSVDDGGILVLVDGLHRALLARELGINSIVVTKAENIACPLVPLPVSWSEVELHKTVPPTAEKRRFRFQSPEEIRRWMFKNHYRFIQGFDFPEKLSWMHYYDPTKAPS